jgi:hypothetical protein
MTYDVIVVGGGPGQMLRWHGLVDLVIRKASRSADLASAISCMFDDLGARRQLLSPRFYWRVLRA